MCLLRLAEYEDCRAEFAPPWIGLMVSIFRHYKRTIFAVSLSLLFFQNPAFAGQGDKLPPAPPNADVAVLALQGSNAEVQASSSSDQPGTGEKLASGTIESKFKSGSLEEQLARFRTMEENSGAQDSSVVKRRGEIIGELRSALIEDILHAKKDLDIDGVTRAETQKLDAKYALLQAAMHNTIPSATNVFTLGTFEETKKFFKYLSGAPTQGPKRLQFVSPVAGFANHFIAGDVYIDPARKIVSLVTWDSVSRFESALSRELDEVLPDGFTLVSHEIRTKIQRLDTGCRQCSLQFTEEMAKLDLHSEQISRLISEENRGADSDEVTEFEKTRFNPIKETLRIERTIGDARHLTIRTLLLTNVGASLDQAVALLNEEDIENIFGKDNNLKQLGERQSERARLVDGVKQNSKSRIVETKSGTETTKKPTRTNLLIDEKRAADMERVLGMLNGDQAADLIAESTYLLERVTERAGMEGKVQSDKIAPLDSDLKSALSAKRPTAEIPLTSQSSSTSEVGPQADNDDYDELPVRRLGSDFFEEGFSPSINVQDREFAINNDDVDDEVNAVDHNPSLDTDSYGQGMAKKNGGIDKVPEEPDPNDRPEL